MTLQEFFIEHPCGALAFSGGVDSAFLLWASLKYGKDYHAYYVKSVFQPEFEHNDALTLAKELNAPITVIKCDILNDSVVSSNPPERCYYCKLNIFTEIQKQAHADGYALLIDGTNASDSAENRPGMKALTELSVRSPLRECNLTKSNIRTLSCKAKLFTWDKPAYACLATRIPHGTVITAQDLIRVEKAEDKLRELGYEDFRVRMNGDSALLQFCENQRSKVNREQDIIGKTLESFFKKITFDTLFRGVDESIEK